MTTKRMKKRMTMTLARTTTMRMTATVTISNQGEDEAVNSSMEEAEQSKKADFWSAMNVHNF